MKKQKNKLIPLWQIKLLNYEFWPFWFFYSPVYLYGIWLGIKAKSFTYFTAANPALHFGGLINSPKSDYLQNVDKNYRPKFQIIQPNSTVNEVIGLIKKNDLEFPLIAKPDMGERGRGVEKINNKQELERYFSQGVEENILLQEFIDYPLELGILYHRSSDLQTSGITSIVVKEFLSIEGDGQSTLRELIRNNTRARFRQEYLEQKFQSRLDNIIPKKEKLKLEPIGNHNRGTAFLNGNHLINNDLVKVMDDIVKPLDGFFYGRFDLKARSLEELYKGKYIKIMEINGVNSEPAHIYQPGYSLNEAYKDIRQHMRIIYKISRENHKNGVPYASLSQVLRELYYHFR